MRHKKYALNIVESHNLIFVAQIKENSNGVAFNGHRQAVNIFKDNYPDFIILPVTREDLLSALQNIEYYYFLYIQLKTNLKAKHKHTVKNMQEILLKYEIIDENDNLLIKLSDYDFGTVDKKNLILKEKSVRKEFELKEVFLQMNNV